MDANTPGTDLDMSPPARRRRYECFRILLSVLHIDGTESLTVPAMHALIDELVVDDTRNPHDIVAAAIRRLGAELVRQARVAPVLPALKARGRQKARA